MKITIRSPFAAVVRAAVFAVLALVWTVPSFAAEPRPIRVLFLGHESQHHNSGKYLPYLMESMGREAIYFDYFTQPDCLKPETLAGFDAVMLYANHGRISDEQYSALHSFIESGGGFIPIHSASACFGNNDGFIDLVGGRFASHGGGEFQASIIAPAHPIMEDVEEYMTWDETYVHDRHNEEGRTVLMERVEGDAREPWAWVREQGEGRVFYTASGHDERTWRNRDFLRKLRNAVVWAVGDEVKAEWETFLASREQEVREKSEHVANYERRPEAITFQHPFSPKGSMERTQVPVGMRLELFASEPDIRKPIAFAFDERGRLWVAETGDYPHGVEEDGIGGDTIRIVEDTNGDGKADKFTVFADGLNIPTGIVFSNGGIIVSQPPRFLFLQDTDGDDVADVREEIMTGWGIGDTHAQASNLHYGLDNWLYGSVGYSGFNGEVGGERMRFGMGTYRFQADGSALEFLHQFTNNTWAHSQNRWGDQFGGTANGAPIFYGGIPQTAFPEGMRGMTAKRINLVNEAHAITPNYRQVDQMGRFTAAAGSAFIDSANMPEHLQGMALVTEPTMKLIALMDVRPDGAGYVAHDGFNLVASSDEWMSPVFAEVGPDGAVWFADFQNFIIQHNPTPSVDRGGYDATTGPGGAHENPLRDHERGRIYRVVWEKAPEPATTSLDNASVPQLLAALGDGNQFWRLKAQQMLIEGDHQAAAPALRDLVAANDGDIAAVHALWALDGLGQLDGPTHQAALWSKDSGLRRNAVRALGTDEAAQALLFGSGTLSDADPITRLAAMVKLSELPTSPEIQTFVGNLSSSPAVVNDEWLAESAKLLAGKHNPFLEGPNLLPNGDLETAGAEGLPDGWKSAGNDSAENGDSASGWRHVRDASRAHGGEGFVFLDAQAGATGEPRWRRFASLVTEVEVKPNTYYRLSGWIRTEGIRGRAFLQDNVSEERSNSFSGDSDWEKVDLFYNTGSADRAEIALALTGSNGSVSFDDLKFVEMLPRNSGTEAEVVAGLASRGQQLFWNHPVASCVNCHTLDGKGSTVGPALDGIASRFGETYLLEALVEPNAALAEGYDAVPVSAMPPMGQILTPQELADVLEFLKTLKI